MTYNDIKSKIYLLTKTNATSFPVADLTILANNALDRVASIIMKSDGRWQWDDTNQTDLPIATTGLVTDQQDYSMDVDHLEVTRVEIKDQNGNWVLIDPIDQQDLYDQSLTDFLKSSGQPRFYDKIGNSFFLYPKPDYTQAASLKVWFKRGPSYFTTSDTTKTPGFSTLYHDLIPLWVSYDYGLANGSSNVNLLMQEIQRKEEALREDYSLRAKDEHIKLSARRSYTGGFR